jgi:hypothetical protein
MSIDKGKTENKVEFGLSQDDMSAIAEGKSAVVPNVSFFGKTAFTIENAPIPKSIRDAIGVEKTITVQMKVKIDKAE